MKPYRNDIVPISDGFISINDNDVPILTITDSYILCFSGNIHHFRVAGCLFERRRFFNTLCSTAGHIILFLSKPLGLVLSLALRSLLNGNFFYLSTLFRTAGNMAPPISFQIFLSCTISGHVGPANVARSSSPWSTTTVYTSHTRLVSHNLCPSLGVHSWDLSRPMPF